MKLIGSLVAMVLLLSSALAGSNLRNQFEMAIRTSALLDIVFLPLR